MLALRLTRGAHPAVHLRRLLVATASAGTGFLLLSALGYAMGHADNPGGSVLRLAWCLTPLAATVHLAVAVARTDPATKPRSGLAAIGLGPTRLMTISAATTALSCALGSLLALLLFLQLRGDLTGLPFDGAAAEFLAADQPLPLPAALTLLSVLPALASVTVAVVLRPRDARTVAAHVAHSYGRFGAYRRSVTRETFGAYGRFGARWPGRSRTASTTDSPAPGARPVVAADDRAPEAAATPKADATPPATATANATHPMTPAADIAPTDRAAAEVPDTDPTHHATAPAPHTDPTDHGTALVPDTAPTDRATTPLPDTAPTEHATTPAPHTTPTDHATAPAPHTAPTDRGTALVPDPAPVDPDPTRPPAPREAPAGLPWGTALLAAGLAVETYAGRTTSDPGAALPGGLPTGAPMVLAGWALIVLGLALAGPGLTHLCGRLLQSARPGALRLLAGRVLMEEATRIGRPLGVVCAVGSGAYAMTALHDTPSPSFGPLSTLGTLLVTGCTLATLLTAAVEARQARADTTAALLRLGAPSTMLRSAAALRAGALLALFGPLTLVVAELAALPLAR
ncbi:hypothetical protein ACFY1L_33600 [Streptomyces sp. NPDC001663]|uniref:hypothetical protein n=1 Tax=Streptomyces sp. NPDC001663 TaxID=3364597 RepID=UPI0036C19827